LSSNVLGDQILKLYRKRGVMDGGDNFPRLSDLYEAIETVEFRKGDRRWGSKDTLVDRLGMVLQHLKSAVDAAQSRDIHKLMNQSVILDFSTIDEVPRTFLFDYLTVLLQVAFPQEAQCGLRLMVIEEAHTLLSRKVDSRYDLGEAPGPSFVRSARKIGGELGVILTDQVPSLLSPATIANLSSMVCFRLGNANCQHRIASAIGLDRYQQRELAKLEARHAVVRVNRVPDPWLLAIDELLFPKPLLRDEARQRCEEILASIPFLEHTEKILPEVGDEASLETQKTASRDALVSNERHIFGRIAERPWELIEDRMDVLGIDRDAEGLARRNLKTRGLIQFAGKVGARHRLFELTARGREHADSMGIKPGFSGKGSVAHEAIVQYTVKALGRCSPKFRFQRSGIGRTTKGRQPDSLLILSSGNRVPIQAMYRNNPDAEANALLDLCELAKTDVSLTEQVDFVLAVAVNKAHLKAVTRALKRRNSGNLPAQLEMVDFDTVVDPSFDWAEVFERPI
jgi:hypothetical protein